MQYIACRDIEEVLTKEIRTIQAIIDSDKSFPKVKLLGMATDELLSVANDCKAQKPNIAMAILSFVRMAQWIANCPRYQRLEVLTGGANCEKKLKNSVP